MNLSLVSLARTARAATSALILAATVPYASADATSVSPVMIDVQSQGRGVVANVSVNNTGATPLPVEITVTPLAANETGFAATDGDTEDLLVVPPSALIPAGQTQTFRVQWIGDPDLRDSRHYYVGVNQVPVKLPEGTSAVQVVYNFQVLTSVASPSQKADLHVRSALPEARSDGTIAVKLRIENTGGAHGYLSQHAMRIVQTDSDGKAVFSRLISGSEFQQLIGYGIVASHSTRTVLLPVNLTSMDGTISVRLTDQEAQ